MAQFLSYELLKWNKMSLMGTTSQQEVVTRYGSSQCLSIGAVSIASSYFLPPDLWDYSTINRILRKGDSLYCKIRDERMIPSSQGYLAVDEITGRRFSGSLKFEIPN